MTQLSTRHSGADLCRPEVSSLPAYLAALSDTEYLQAAVIASNQERNALTDRLNCLELTGGYGLRIAPSHGNFLSIDTAKSVAELPKR